VNIAAPIPELPERAVRPLLRLAHLISGVEWTCGTMLGDLRGDLAEDCVFDATQREGMGLIADAMQQLLASERDRRQAVASAEAAGLCAAQALEATVREVLYSQRMKRLAHTDALTGLPNRRAFMKKWQDASARSQRRGHAIGLLFIDADRFKEINDGAGHAKGDVVLRAIGAILMTLAQSPDFAARIGGDEFALCSVHTDEGQLQALGDRIREQFKLVAAELAVDTTLSIGMVSSESCAPENMLAYADLALYRSKESGGDAARLHARGGAAVDAHGRER
jgi:diguanylate cyclase (GGDEF)-like protein